MSEQMAQRIRDLRQEKGLTLEQVADVVGVGKSTVRKWETGIIANMRRDKIASLAKALGTTPAYLMGWEDVDTPTHPQPNKQEVPERNIIRIAGRDGSYEERVLTDEQINALKVILNQLPDASGDL
jgi:transcriptional regulator with XRE-family HTH domain